MEITKVKELPLSNKGMNEDLLKLIGTLEKMKEGEILEFSEKGRTSVSIKSSLKTAARRVPSATFTMRAKEEKVYVRKDKDLIPQSEAPKVETKTGGKK